MRFEGPGIVRGTTVRGHLHEARITVLDGRDGDAAPPEQAHRLRRRAEPGRASKDDEPRDPDRHGGHERRRDALRRRVRLEQGRRLRHGRSSRTTRSCRAPPTTSPVTRRRAERPRARRGARPALRAHALRQRDLGRRHDDATRRSRTCRCTTPSRRRSSTAGRSSTTRAHVEQRRGVVRELPHLRRLRQPRLGPRQPRRRRRSNNPNPFELGARRRPGLPSAEGADDDAEPARHGEPRADALARRPHGRQRSGRRARSTRTRRSRSSTSPSTACSAASGPLTDAEMQAFTDFILQVTYPPNPIRALDNSLTADAAGGPQLLLRRRSPTSSATATAATCSIPRHGFFGTDGFIDASRARRRTFKIPHLRNMYQKVGMFGMPAVPFLNTGDNGNKGDQVRGFGFLHDGSIDTRLPLPQRAASFNARRDTEQRQTRAVHARLRHEPGADRRPADHAHEHERRRPSAPRIDLLIARAAAGECELVVKGTLAGEQRGWLPARRTARSRATAPASADHRREAARAGDAPPARSSPTPACRPARATRIGVDRDEDGFFDRDELDAGSDPADPASFPGAPAAILIRTTSLSLKDDNTLPVNLTTRKVTFRSRTRRVPGATASARRHRAATAIRASTVPSSRSTTPPVSPPTW